MSEIHIKTIRRVPKPERRPTRLSALILWVIAAAGLLLFPLISAPLNSMTAGLNPHVQLLISNALYYLIFAALPVYLLAKRTPGLYMAYRPNPISLFNAISVVVIALLGMFFANDLAVLWSIPLQKMGMDVLSTSLPAVTNKFELTLSILYVAVLPGVCEEFLFRGAVLSAFEEEGTKRAMIASSLLFMLVHGTILGAPTQFILGMILSCLVVWTNSIYAGLIYHTVHNAATLFLQFAQDRAAAPEAAAQTPDLLELVGGIGGMGVLLMEVLLSGAMILFTLKMFKLRGRLAGITEDPRKEKSWNRRELTILVLGIILCCVLYVMDFCARINFLGG